jgi:hypothetical protein
MDNNYTPSPGTIQEHYGIDIENELASLLSDELAKSIDAEILKGLFEQAKPFKRRNSIDKIYKKRT